MYRQSDVKLNSQTHSKNSISKKNNNKGYNIFLVHKSRNSICLPVINITENTFIEGLLD